MQGNIRVVIDRILSFFKEEDFIRKIRVTLGMLLLYRTLYFIPLPGLNLEIIDKVYSNELQIPNLLNMFLGNIKDLSILTIGISSYITCSLFFHFIPFSSEYFHNLKKEGSGRHVINDYIRYSSFIHAFITGYFGSYYIKSFFPDLIFFPGHYFHLSSALFVATGAMITVWIADQITIRGIGNGSSLIIFINIIQTNPDTLFKIIENLNSGILTYETFIIFSVLLSVLLFIIVYCERIYRSYKVLNISKKNLMFSTLPENSLIIKLNPAGIMPAMFLGHVLIIPSLIKKFWDYTQYYYGALFETSFNNYGYMFILLQGIVLFLSSYPFAEALFNPQEKAMEFKSRTMIPGVRPGEETKKFLEEKLFIISILGGIYLAIVCCIPLLVHVYFKNQNLPKVILDLLNIQGASLIIIVGVVYDFMDKIVAGINYKLTELNFINMHKKF